jgi:aryl-alcohol dehydrogenase-like predicted oxidoreductase
LREIAERKNGSVAQLALAWILSKGKEIVPLVGARRRQQLAEALETLAISFSPDEIAAIERAVPPGAVAGDRYGAEQMAALDSERPRGASSSAR